MKRIITIGREFGAGGGELGRRLARELDIAYYDRDIILKTAKASAQLAAAQGLVTVGHKDGQQGKFPRRQAKLAAGAAHTVGAQVNGQVFVGNVRIIRGHDRGPPFR